MFFVYFSDAGICTDTYFTDDDIVYFQDFGCERYYTDYILGNNMIANGFHSFVDSRSDPYMNGEVLDAMHIYYFDVPEDDMLEILNKYRFDAIILDNECHATQAWINHLDGWSLDYEGSYFKVYKYSGEGYNIE